MTVKTVERAVTGLVKKGLIRFFRHGGRNNRNRYEIIWQRLKELEAEWCSRFNAAAKARATKLSRPTRHSRSSESDRNVHQTYSSNLLNRTYSQPGRKKKPDPHLHHLRRQHALRPKSGLMPSCAGACRSRSIRQHTPPSTIRSGMRRSTLMSGAMAPAFLFSFKVCRPLGRPPAFVQQQGYGSFQRSWRRGGFAPRRLC